MKALTFAATFAGLFYGVIASGATAEAARCPQGQIYRPSQGVCVSKASAIRAGIYRPRTAKARTRDRVRKRPPVERAAIPALRCDALCELKIALPKWAARNAASFGEN